MKYAFALGRHPSLSVAELIRAIPDLVIEAIEGGVAIGSCPELVEGFLNLLGGTIKIAKIDAEYKTLDKISAAVLRNFLPAREGRVIFGISMYGHFSGPERRTIYMEGLALK